MLCLIGNSPSSGSTFLADILDSTPFSACGNELNFFSNTKLYDFDRFKANPRKTSACYQISSTDIIPMYERIERYGLSWDDMKKMIEQSSDVVDFGDRFSQHFLGFREKDINGVQFEKTPQNLNSIGEYLDKFPDGWFVSIVRNPLHIFPSLLRRGFGPYTALNNWLVDMAKTWQYKDHERVIIIQYEDLVANPFELTLGILHKIIPQFQLSTEELENGYSTNAYRKKMSGKIKSWTINKYGERRNANAKKISEENLRLFAPALHSKLHPQYAKLFGLNELSFETAARHFDYWEPILEALGDHGKNPGTSFLRNGRDKRKLLTKWTRTMKKGEAGIGDMGAFLHPVISGKN